MARFNYDVDKITRYIDIHKQFQGGLKTVDTDDALKDVYLREAENISLSEFNFIEKRYGLHKLDEHNPWGGATPNIDSVVQGYFEYYVDADTVHKIIVIEGNFYINQGAGFNKVELEPWLNTLLEENIDAIVIHARTMKEMSKARIITKRSVKSVINER